MKVLQILFLTPLSWIWALSSSFKNYLYDAGFFSTEKLPLSVISVGNLTMGGVGKTPLVEELSQQLSTNKKVAVISRSYKGTLKSPARVYPEENKAAKVYGDEAVLLARLNPQIPVFSGPNKTETACFALKEVPNLDVLIVDDGFQHRRLSRQCDIVVLDATEPFENYKCFPLGRARESWAHMERADIFIVTRANLVSEEDLMALLARLPSDKPCFVTSIVADSLFEWNFATRTWKSVDFSLMKTLRPRLITGLGRPEQFQELVSKTFHESFEMTRFPDHHEYRSEDFSFLKSAILTTEKDAVKMIALEPKSFTGQRLFVLKTRYAWENGIEQLVRGIEPCLQKL